MNVLGVDRARAGHKASLSTFSVAAAPAYHLQIYASSNVMTKCVISLQLPKDQRSAYLFSTKENVPIYA
jgi:hypothetical protein